MSDEEWIMKKKIVIIGSGGLGREVLDLIDACNQAENLFDLLGFVVDPQYGKTGTIIDDKPILGGFDWLETKASKVYVVCAIGQPHLRLRVVNRLIKMNCRFINLIHPWTKQFLHKWVTVGEGVILNGCQTSNQIIIGNHVFINALSIIGHDDTIMDFVTIAPGVHADGNVTLETGCYIGSGANLLPKVRVGEWSVIGAGSVINKDIPPNTSAISLPPRVISQREPGWHLLAD
jgi:sugar O-acyltransferase (sialic acid O-acetyltransferase NeuD family)